MMNIIINNGSGDIPNTTEQHAIENMKHLLVDSNNLDVNMIRIPEKDYEDGRYAFLLWKGTDCREVQMVGLPLEQVRFMNEKTQDIWQFPRIYIDGSSWIWKISVENILKPFKANYDKD